LNTNPILYYYTITDITDESKTASVDVLVINKELKDLTNSSHLFQADVTDGSKHARLIAWGPVAIFFNNKIFAGSCYKFFNITIRKTPPQYIKSSNYIPFDLALTSGVTVEISSTRISEPEVGVLIKDITKYVNNRINTVGVIIDYESEISPTNTNKGTTVSRRSITIADEHFKIKVTLWADTAEQFVPQQGQTVKVQNALVKAYGSEVSLSCSKISYANENDPKAKHLSDNWQEIQETVSFLPLTKHRLDSQQYKTVDLNELPSLQTNSTVKIVAKIDKVHYESYHACNTCRTAVITMDTDSFCSKCSKVVPVSERYTFTLTLDGFCHELVLFHDNVSTLCNISDFEENTQESINFICNKTYTILVLKRLNRRQEMQFVALDFEPMPKTAKRLFTD